MPILRTYRYRELFPAVSITVLPVTMKERLLQEPVRTWLKHPDTRIPLRILAGLCLPEKIPTLGEAEASSLLEQDLISAIQREKDYLLTDKQLAVALRFFAFQRDELPLQADLEGYHEMFVERILIYLSGSSSA